MSAKPSIAIVGAGRVGTALGILFRRSGYPIRGVVRRSLERARESVRLIGAGTPCADAAEGARDADIVLFAVPDDAVAEVAALVRASRSFRPGNLLVHTSGALPAAVLGGSAAPAVLARADAAPKASAGDLCTAEGATGFAGASPGSGAGCAARWPGLLSMHPVQAVADPVSGAERLAGAYFGLEGDPHAVEAGEKLVADIGGRPLHVAPGGKALYHAAACVAGNYVLTLVDVALKLFEEAGVGRDDALRVIGGLMAAAHENAASFGVAQALTGPIDRGDANTIRSHLAAFQAMPAGPERARVERVYRLLGIETLDLARRKRGSLAEGHELIERMLYDKGHERWSV